MYKYWPVIIKQNLLFLLLLTANIIFGWLQYRNGYAVSKVLLMPVLIFKLIKAGQGFQHTAWRLVLAGLLFAWLGDILLLWTKQHVLFFILGLCSFLITHVLYVLYFLKEGAQPISWFTKHLAIAILILLYAIVFYGFLFPYCGSLAIPVLIYTLAICSMVLTAISTKATLQTKAWCWLVGGALLFMISDSLLAFDKFYQAFSLATPLIMLSYGLAQWCITEGAIVNEKNGEI